MSRRAPNRRIRLLLLAFVLLFGVVLARAAWLQGVNGASFERLALSQHRRTVEIPAGRGTIFDRNGEPLAIGEQATTVYADPRAVTDPKRAALAVGRTLGLEPNFVYHDLTQRSRGFVYVQRKADPVAAARLERQDIAGLGFYSEEKRVYPQSGVAAQVVGYAGTDNRGLEGLERSLDPVLAGRPGSETIVTDPFGRVIDVVKSRPERRGRDVTLTIDHQIQANAESVLDETVRRWHAKGGAAIVLDPRTGEILAMANAPGFDSNRFGAVDPSLRRNRAVTDVYEPGSTFKIVTISGALEDGVVTPSTRFTLPPTIRVADRTIHDAEPRGTERMTVRQILTHSSNVGTVTIAQELGAERLSAWVHRWGFGARTGVDFPGESPGMVLPLEQWSGSTIGTVPIGLGIAVTPVQMAATYATIANGGVRPTPHLVRRVGGRRVAHPRGRRVVSRATARQVMAMLRDVVVEGTGTEAAIPGYTVAGKTGTANKPTAHGYSTSRYVASFVGIVPARNPRLVVMVMVDEPRGAIWGGVVAAPAFARIAQFDLQYLEVPPDAPKARALAGPGSLFFCVPGARADGHDFAAEAVRNGAVALVVERRLDVAVPQVVVEDVRAAMAIAADVFFGEPTRQLEVAGVTGTNGKTTTAFLLRSILEQAGRRPGLVGTVEWVVGGERRAAPFTTPEAIELQRLFREMLDAGDRSVAMEASSHGSALRRLDRVRFDALAFTNLSQDHLDLHGTLEEYFQAKRRLFTGPTPPPAAVNVGCEAGRRLAEELAVAHRAPLVTFGMSSDAEVRPERLRLSPAGSSFVAAGIPIETRLRGRFNVENVLAAVAASLLLELDDDAIAAGVAAVEGVPGRFEAIDLGQPFAVIVDYAHTPDSLDRVLEAARELGDGRLIVVFGAGGDRDRGKRPLMGRVARSRADVVVVTSDNPRSEEPLAIIEDVLQGAGTDVEIDPDRRSAISRALELAAPGDVVVVAGKGHEQGQEVAGVVHPFDDRTVVAELLQGRDGL